MTTLNNGTGAAPSAAARVVASTGSSSVSSSSKPEANGGVGDSIGGAGGSARGLNDRLLLAETGGGASRGITAPTMPQAAMACLAKQNSTAPVPGANNDSASSTSSASTSTSDNSSGVSLGTGRSTDGHPAPKNSTSNVSEARVASNGGSQPEQPAATVPPEPNQRKQSSPFHQTSALATNGASPVRQAPTPPPPTQSHPVIAPASSTVPAARPPAAAESLSGKPAAGPKAKAAGGDGGRPESGVEESTPTPAPPDVQSPPPPPPNTPLPNPVATGIPPPLPAPSCRSQSAPRPEANLANRAMPLPRAAAAAVAEPVPPPPPSGTISTLACVAAPPSTSTPTSTSASSSSSSDPAPTSTSTPPVKDAGVAAGGTQAASRTRDQPAVPPAPPAASEVTPAGPLLPVDAPAATETAPPAAPAPEASTPAASSTATPPAAPATKRPRKETCGDESDRVSSSDMEVDSDTGSAPGVAGLSTDQKEDGTGEDAAEAEVIVGSQRLGGEFEGAGESGTGGAEGAPSPPPGRSSKRARVVVGAIPGEEIRPVAAPVQEPFLEVPEVSEADVGKMVISETSRGTLTGVVESFSETEDGLGVWTIRYENGNLKEIEDCGELHDDMCGYFELAGNAAAAEAKQVRTRKSPSLQEEVRSALFGDERSAIGKRVRVIRDKVLHEGQITKYVQPTRDGEFEQWRVTYTDGTHEDMDSFELVRPLLRHMERRIEQREVEWGHRTVLVYMHRVGDSSRPFTTLSGISASMPTVIRNEEQDDQDS